MYWNDASSHAIRYTCALHRIIASLAGRYLENLVEAEAALGRSGEHSGTLG